MRHLLVEDSRSLLEAGGQDSDVIWTQSSGLQYVDAVKGNDVRMLEESVPRNDLQALWRDLLAGRPSHAEILAETEAAPAYAYLARACARTVYTLTLQLGTKALLLQRWLAAVSGNDLAVVGAPRLTPVSQLQVPAGEYDHIFAALAGAIPEGLRPQILETSAIPRESFMASFNYVPPIDKILNSVNRPKSSLKFKLWQRRAAPVGLGERGTLQILRENELIEESFTELTRDGWKIIYTPLTAVDAGMSCAPPESKIAALCQIFAHSIQDHVSGGVKVAAERLFRDRIDAMLRQYPGVLAGVRARVAQWRRDYGEDSKCWAILSNGLYAPTHRLHDVCLREAGARVVCTDHGTGVGLLERLEPLIDDVIGFSDHYLTFNTEVEKLFSCASAGEGLDTRTVGAPTEMSRARYPRLQRALTRRVAGFRRSDALLIYVTSIGQNNLVQGLGMGTDLEYAGFQRSLVDCLGAFPGRRAIKPYPAYRFADPEQIWVMPLPDGTERMAFGDFRHIRWAADVLLLDVHSSTIGWALGCDRPIIYVDNPADPLTQRAREAIRESVFYVDGSAPDYSDRVRALLMRGVTALQRDWERMASARATFCERFVLGTPGSPAPRVAEAMRDVSTTQAPPRLIPQTVSFSNPLYQTRENRV